MKKRRYGMVIDLDRCTGCGACMMACAVENNVAPAPPGTGTATGVTWLRVERVTDAGAGGDVDAVFVPMMCQQCGNETPCVAVCPQNAVEADPATGIVGQVPQRCLGCRYCMAACPYHARYFNWWDPAWEKGVERMLNPDVSPRMRGVVEKCNFCHGRLHNAIQKAAAAGKDDILPGDYQPACAGACPEHAILFGDIDDASSEAACATNDPRAFRFLSRLGTEPHVWYLSSRSWVRTMAEKSTRRERRESDAA
jgi:molybdopterin-containing oxidoreductase family iron-sulfur binding subunit